MSLAVDEMALDELAVDEMAVDDLTPHRVISNFVIFRKLKVAKHFCSPPFGKNTQLIYPNFQQKFAFCIYFLNTAFCWLKILLCKHTLFPQT